MPRENALIVSLDIGTYKTALVVAEVTPDDIEVLGVGTALSGSGLRKSQVINIDATVQAVKRAVEEAQTGASCEIHNVCASVTGEHILSIPSQGAWAVKDQEVSQADVQRVLEIARAVALPSGYEILHVLPQSFLVDGQESGRNPLGSAGVRLEASVQIIAGASDSIQTIYKCGERAGLHVRNVHFAGLAAAEAVLSPEEKELGVVVVDVGGGTTGLVAYQHSVVQHASVLPVGGSHITNDLAVGLRTTLAEAEKLKQKYGCALTNLVPNGESVEMPKVGSRDPLPMPRRRLSEIIEPRVEEIFSLVREELERSGVLSRLESGVVLTGGSSIMDGMVEAAERVFRTPVRRGAPRYLSGIVDAENSPMYATGVGLILCELQRTPLNGAARVRDAHGWQRMRERVVGWIRDFF
jgi:cell division protein FtsA